MVLLQKKVISGINWNQFSLFYAKNVLFIDYLLQISLLMKLCSNLRAEPQKKIIIPGKPIPIGFKIFALGDSGYTYNWKYTKPGLAKRVLIEKKRTSINISNSKLFSFLNPI